MAKRQKMIEAASVTDPAPRSTATENSHFPIVGIVASAGGLDAFKRFFAAMPSPAGMAFVVVPHLDAKHKSSMVELLARQTSMPVVEASHNCPVEVNAVYVIPPNHGLSLLHGHLQLSDLPNPIGAQTAIDAFLRSLASDQEERAVGIILSGTGSHGTAGIREIKRCGGMVIVQSLESAEFDQMPRSAIDTGLVDFILSPDAMPATLLHYAQHPYVNRSQPSPTKNPNAQKLLADVLELLRHKSHFDFRAYRQNMILRRIERRMGLLQLNDMAEYLLHLNSEPHEADALCKDLLISVTAFFRDTDVFNYLEQDLFPKMLDQLQSQASLRVWIPACATGEEAYSITILLWEAIAAAEKEIKLQVFASDINPQSIEVARRGVYPASIIGDLSPARLKRHFTSTDEVHYRVSKQLRDSIVFSRQNLVEDAPFSKLDFISCRNVLIYLEPPVQQRLVSLFHYALNQNGLLLLGPAETVGLDSALFEPVSKKLRIYRRYGANLPASKIPTPDQIHAISQSDPSSPSSTPKKSIRDLAESFLRDYAPAAVLINDRYDVLYVSGPVVNYLEFPTGSLSKNLLSMARTGLRTKLRAICQHAIATHTTISDHHASVQRHEGPIPCSLTAKPILQPLSSENLVLVVFQDQPALPRPSTTSPLAQTSPQSQDPPLNPHLIQLLEYELKTNREELQNTIEEMVSANEELQSSNEELESSKEEFQSLNEELSTVNCQLLEKVSELDTSNSEIHSLMASADIAAIYLDSELRIKRFTQPSIALFHLLESDVGRKISDFTSPIVDPQLLNDCQQVLTSPSIIESELTTADNRDFLRRISPFLSQNLDSLGVVVTFIDLTARNRQRAKQQERDARFREIFDHAPTGIAIANLDGYLEKCNPAYCQFLGYSESELRNIHFLTLIHPDDQARNRDELTSLMAGQVPFFEIENRYLHRNGDIVWARKIVSTLPDGGGKPCHLMALVTDISAHRQTLDALRQSEERIRTILRTASDAIITINHQGLIDSVNQATESIFGYSGSELVGQNVNMLMPQPFRDEHDGYIQRFLTTGEPRVIGTGREVICRRKDGSTFPADLAVSQVDHLGLFTGILRDITNRKEMQQHIIEIATDEQRRLGLELHDGIQQELTGLSLYANALHETLQRALPVDSDQSRSCQFQSSDVERLEQTTTLLATRLAETNRHVRDLAHGIMPVQIDAEGLQSSLTDLARSLHASQSIHCTFECHGNVTFPNNTTATHLYRIAQEAVSNAVRHGSATQIRIGLSQHDDRVSLEISDNGTGLQKDTPLDHVTTPKAMGMRTMEYRASLIGARIQVQPNPDGGTLVRCDILMNKRAQ